MPASWDSRFIPNSSQGLLFEITNILPSRTMLGAPVRHRLEDREDALSPYAARSRCTRGRNTPEEPSALRTEYQRDRDRIIHCKSFRRLKHKTQVFIAPLGDHYVTRLTHTLEVSQIARTIARALSLNEDLAEAISLGHDMGHTPFGHVGEDELNKLHPQGFRHNHQSLKIVEQLENDGKGLNLTWEVRQGIVSHSKPRGDFLGSELTQGLTFEAQIVRISDAVAYLNHDLADAFRAGVLKESVLPQKVVSVIGDRHSRRVDSMVTDIVESSWDATGCNGIDIQSLPVITMSPLMKDAVLTLREFMFENVYIPEDRGAQGRAARRMVQLLYQYFNTNRDRIPPEYQMRSRSEDEAVVDYIAGMTDHYAIRMAETIEPGIANIFAERQI
jgi:dGTPase